MQEVLHCMRICRHIGFELVRDGIVEGALCSDNDRIQGPTSATGIGGNKSGPSKPYTGGFALHEALTAYSSSAGGGRGGGWALCYIRDCQDWRS